MKLTVKNLGPIKEGTFDLSKDLIVFTGDNNTGKTYALNLALCITQRQSTLVINLDENLFTTPKLKKQVPDNTISTLANHHLNEIKKYFAFDLGLSNDEASDIEAKYSLTIADIQDAYHSTLGREIITNSNFKIIPTEFDDEVVLINTENGDVFSSDITEYHSIWSIFMHRLLFHILASNLTRYAVYVAERGALAIFSDAILKNQVASPAIDIIDGQAKIVGGIFDYSLALRDSIVNAKLITSEGLSVKREDSVNELIHLLQTELIEGEATFVDTDKKFVILNNGLLLPFAASSSSIKSLASIVYSLLFQTHPGRLFIDEPELNLHPNRQSAFGRIMAQAVGQGSRFLITTHSDYIIRELVILCKMFLNKDKIDLADYPDYTEDMLIDPQRVGMYYFDKTDGIVKEVPFTVHGFAIPSMDGEVNRQNKVLDNLFADTYE